MESEKNDIKIYLAIICILLFLIIYVSESSKSIGNCSECSIVYKYTLPNTETENTLEVNITDLYNYYKKGECLVTWQRSQGFVYNG